MPIRSASACPIANTNLPSEIGVSERTRFISGWLTTSHLIDGNALKFTFVWGQSRAEHDPSLNSFLGEAIYQLGNNKFFGRAEILQIMPGQLDLTSASGRAAAKWVKAFTIGYERTLFQRDQLFLLAGGAYTKDLVPAEFTPAYGSDPQGFKAYLRLKFMADFGAAL